MSARSSRAPTSPERRDRPHPDQGSQDRTYGQGSPDFGGGVGYIDDDVYCRGPIPESTRSPNRATPTRRTMSLEDVHCNPWSLYENGSVREPT